MTSPTPERADGQSPTPHVRAARRTLPPGSAGRAAPPSPVGGAAHLDRETGPVPAGRSPRDPLMEPAGSATTRPGAGSRQGGTAPGREGARTPAGGAHASSQATSALSAGQMAIARAMSEDRGPDSLDAHVRRLMDDLGLWGYHPLNSIGSRRGWPDWTIIGTRIIYRELKTERGTLRPDQALVRDKILAAGGDWGLWRPADLLTRRIARELAAISALGAGAA